MRDPHEIAQSLWNRFDRRAMQAVSAALKTGGANDKKRGIVFDQALAAQDSIIAIQALSGLYYTQAGKVRSKLYDAKSHDLAKDWIDTHSLDIMEAYEAIKACHIFALTESVFHISLRYAELYRDAKHRARGLDYSDQILFVRRLLENSEAADWVR